MKRVLGYGVVLGSSRASLQAQETGAPASVQQLQQQLQQLREHFEQVQQQQRQQLEALQQQIEALKAQPHADGAAPPVAVAPPPPTDPTAPAPAVCGDYLAQTLRRRLWVGWAVATAASLASLGVTPLWDLPVGATIACARNPLPRTSRICECGPRSARQPMIIAIPLVAGSLSEHSGHCEECVLIDVDRDSKKIKRTV